MGERKPGRAQERAAAGRPVLASQSTARLGALATVAYLSSLFIIAVPARRRELSDVSQGITPAQESVLRDLGLGVRQWADLVSIQEAAVVLVIFAIALLILARRPNDWAAILIAAALPAHIVSASPTLDALSALQPEWQLPVRIADILGLTLSTNAFFLFPDGRFYPRWTRWLAALSVLQGVVWLLFPGSFLDFSDPYRLPVASFVILVSWRLVGISAQVWRYRKVATPLQRQQTKVLLFGVSIAQLGYIIFGFNRFALPLFAGPQHASIVYDLFGVPIFLFTTLAIPFAFAYSILRRRLWEIDLLINRAVLYAGLTALLAGLYIASIAFSQRLFIALTGDSSDAPIVLTTLIIASAFVPLRNRLQAVVDRYFKPPPEPTQRVRELGRQVRDLMEVLNEEKVVRLAVDEATRGFLAQGGAAYLAREHQYRAAYVAGQWEQREGMSAWLESEGTRFGWITLGPRGNGQAYSMQDRQSFTELVGLVAQALQVIKRRRQGSWRRWPAAAPPGGTVG